MVNTFIVYPSFSETAATLDRKRLGKQRVEALQILKANMGMTKGWVNHPAAVMWRGYEPALCLYGLAMCEQWVSYGYKDTCAEKFTYYLNEGLNYSGEADLPNFIYDNSFLDSHRSNLIRKDPVFYGQYDWQVDDDLPYLWPGQSNLVLLGGTNE